MKDVIKEGLGGKITQSILIQNELVFKDTSLNYGIESEGYD
jgi:hypothetical protein